MNSNTEIIHSIPVDELTGALSVPIYQTSTFVQEAPGINRGYDYARTNNPTRAALEKIIAQLEGGSTGIAFASGLAAIDAVIKLLESGDEIVAVDDIYGGAFRMFNHIYDKFGVKVNYIDTTGKNLMAFNLVYEMEFEFERENNKTHLGLAATPVEFDLAFVHFFKPQIGLGFEAVNHNDIVKGKINNSLLYAGPTFNYRGGAWFVIVNYLPQLINLHKTSVSPFKKDLANHERAEARILLGFSL
jgi:hypothetical protein